MQSDGIRTKKCQCQVQSRYILNEMCEISCAFIVTVIEFRCCCFFFILCFIFFFNFQGACVCVCLPAGWCVKTQSFFDCIAFDQAPCVFAYCRVAPWMVRNIYLIYCFFSFLLFFVCVPLTDVIVFFFNFQFTFKSNSNFSAVQIKQHFDRRTANAWVSRRALIRTARTKQKHNSSSVEWVVCVCDHFGTCDKGIKIKQNRFRDEFNSEIDWFSVKMNRHSCMCALH